MVVNRQALLCQVAVVSEGVDLPIRRALDLSPYLSPVRFLQQFGRITRPVAQGESAPEYVSCNRNILRHSYLLEGLLPPATYLEAQQAFSVPSRRAGSRAMGLEALGRFRPVEVRFSSGIVGQLYSVSFVNCSTVQEYACLVHPLQDEVIWAAKKSAKKEDGTRDWGAWERVAEPDEVLKGYQSVPGNALTEKQLAWWNRSAAKHGIDPLMQVNKANFQVLPLCQNLGLYFR